MTGLAAQLPALQVVIPLLAAPVCAVLATGRAAWVLATVVSWVSFAISAWLLGSVLDIGAISYELGGWAAPWGIEYRIDMLNALVLLIVSGSSSLALIYARRSIERELPQARIYLFYTAWLLALAGLLGIAITGDAFNAFVFLEISSLATYILVSFGSERRAFTAAFRYLVLGTVGATFFLIGVGMLYMMSGTLNMNDLATRLAPINHTHAVRAAFAFITVGLALKAALFPLHAWLPNAYTFAPSAATVFLAASATKVAIYLWLRFLFTVFGVEFAVEALEVGRLAMVLALMGALAGSLMALYQHNVKRLLAYSSVAQVGYMILGISFASVVGLTGGVVHLFNHALMKATLFMAVGNVVYRTGVPTLSAFDGIGRRMPWTMGAFVIAGLSLIGVPLTTGFVSKWHLLLAAVERGWWWVVLVVVLASLLAVMYLWKVVERAYFGEPEPGSLQARAEEVPLSMLIPTWTFALANLYFGINTELSAGVARRIAEMLLGTGS